MKTDYQALYAQFDWMGRANVRVLKSGWVEIFGTLIIVITTQEMAYHLRFRGHSELTDDDLQYFAEELNLASQIRVDICAIHHGITQLSLFAQEDD